MPLTDKEVRDVAKLAHLELADEEVRTFLPQLGSIVEYMQKLNQLDTTHVEPMAQATISIRANPSVRNDFTFRAFGADVAVASAPEHGQGYFKVPQVIERE